MSAAISTSLVEQYDTHVGDYNLRSLSKYGTIFTHLKQIHVCKTK